MLTSMQSQSQHVPTDNRSIILQNNSLSVLDGVVLTRFCTL